ncbi:hypothetical protein [Sinimarinibacterium flocculans]|uniref:Uncharacterized protein n=1 Tax=Sinimarinibacterium flocculans TaxID=985250 RepID=A0A318EBT9_9GAMM|nr:hypothetical protein [Sinimarinibacterium flocculans]PXV67218.1 hypothetical protein C8D93_106195 [Sinimarinibacterium flocculans]
MAQASVRTLGEELGGAPIAGLDALDAAEQQALAAAVRKARQRQQALLAQAFDAALAHLPMLLRGPVRKILLP